MVDIQHGVIVPGDGPGGNKGVHTFEGLTSFADEAARLAYVQVAGDRGRVAFQVGGIDPGWYVADGAGNWLYLGDPLVPQVFGRDYQREAELTRTTTSLTTPVTKVTMVTPALTGTYRVAWGATVDQSATNQAVRARLRNVTDGLTVGSPHIQTPQDTGDRMKAYGANEIVFAGLGKNLQLQYNAVSGGTAGCADAFIELWRVG